MVLATVIGSLVAGAVLAIVALALYGRTQQRAAQERSRAFEAAIDAVRLERARQAAQAAQEQAALERSAASPVMTQQWSNGDFDRMNDPSLGISSAAVRVAVVQEIKAVFMKGHKN